MMEWRLIADADVPDRPLDAGLFQIGTLPDGRGVFDCQNAPPLGELVSRGRDRRGRAPWWVRRYVDTEHRWAGER